MLPVYPIQRDLWETANITAVDDERHSRRRTDVQFSKIKVKNALCGYPLKREIEMQRNIYLVFAIELKTLFAVPTPAGNHKGLLC